MKHYHPFPLSEKPLPDQSEGRTSRSPVLQALIPLIQKSSKTACFRGFLFVLGVIKKKKLKPLLLPEQRLFCGLNRERAVFCNFWRKKRSSQTLKTLANTGFSAPQALQFFLQLFSVISAYLSLITLLPESICSPSRPRYVFMVVWKFECPKRLVRTASKLFGN